MRRRGRSSRRRRRTTTMTNLNTITTHIHQTSRDHITITAKRTTNNITKTTHISNTKKDRTNHILNMNGTPSGTKKT
eukprot:8108365-Pyramimonas_sp.AAC.1